MNLIITGYPRTNKTAIAKSLGTNYIGLDNYRDKDWEEFKISCASDILSVVGNYNVVDGCGAIRALRHISRSDELTAVFDSKKYGVLIIKEVFVDLSPRQKTYCKQLDKILDEIMPWLKVHSQLQIWDEAR